MEWILLVVGVVVGAALGWWWGRRDLGPRLDEVAEEAGALAEDNKRLERELRHTLERAEQAEQRLGETEAAKAESDAAGEAARSALEDTKHELAEVERSVKSLGHQLEKAEANRQELAERATAAEHAAEDAHARFDQVTEDYVALKREARRAEEDRQAVHADRDGTVARLELATAGAQREAAELRADHGRLEKALSVATARLEALEGCAEAAAEAQEELRALRTDLAGQTRRAGELGSELAATRSQLVERERALTERDRELTELRAASATQVDPSPPVGGAPRVTDEELSDSGRPAPPGAPLDPPGPQSSDDDGTSPADRTSPDDGDAQDEEASPDDGAAQDEEASPDDGAAQDEEASPGDGDAQDEEASPGDGAATTPPAGAATAGSIPSDAEQAPVTEPAEQHDDALQSIKGIGPKFERMLNDRNVRTFRQVAELRDDAEWETYLETFAGRIEREEWRPQARQLHREKYGESL